MLFYALQVDSQGNWSSLLGILLRQVVIVLLHITIGPNAS